MEISRKWKFSWLLLGLFFLAHSLQSVTGEAEVGPSESECRPYIEKALKDLETAEITETEQVDDSPEDALDVLTEGSEHDTGKAESTEKELDETHEDTNTETSTEIKDEQSIEVLEAIEEIIPASLESGESIKEDEISKEEVNPEQASSETLQEQSLEKADESIEEQADEPRISTEDSKETEEDKGTSVEEQAQAVEEPAASVETEITTQETEEQLSAEKNAPSTNEPATSDEVKEESIEEQAETQQEEAASTEDKSSSVEENEAPIEIIEEPVEEKAASAEENATKEASAEDKEGSIEEKVAESVEQKAASIEQDGSIESVEEQATSTVSAESTDDEKASAEEPESTVAAEIIETETTEDSKREKRSADETQEDQVVIEKVEVVSETTEPAVEGGESVESVEEEAESKESLPVDDLSLGIDIPENLRPREHLNQILKLDDDNSELESTLNRVSEVTLRELKRVYEGAIRPLETLYKYRDLSNRHFGDSEVFSKPLVLFMGPWSGGKSSIINYLSDNEYNATSLRTGAEPSPAYFNLVMHGEEPEVLDGTQLAADFTFAGLQKFGQGLEERLRGLKLPNKLLEKINIVEIPGILEVRKQVSRVFPFNDACQWFIDRADIIFLVYDPSKLDVGPETEAILDQLKGREHQTRIVLNKADQVKPEELMRVQSALIWNISPLMSSAQPPAMYTTSLWSRPYESWAPVRLLQAQEREFLKDLRSAIEKRIENKIASARRFAVRVRNHAKMVDCYLTTYYNHKSVFGNRKQVADQIIEHPQDYHIYEGLSTLTNISRYDLPDPDVYRDFFRLNPLYEFQQLSATCTYFRGCPINKLDVAIAYDLPELVGKHKKLLEAAVAKIKTES